MFIKELRRGWLGVANAVASGMMLAASFGLLYEGARYGLWQTVGGAVVGLAFILVARSLLGGDHEQLITGLSGANARKMLLIVGVMTIHSITEGVSVGVSFGGGLAFGLFITIAIAVHNIPEGLAISLVLVPRGVRVIKAAWWSVFSSLPQPLMAVPAFLFVAFFKPLLPWGLGFAAGAMIWMVFSELMQEAYEDARPAIVGVVATVSILAMFAFQISLQA